MSSLILTVAGGPYRLCVIGYDVAGNPTPPLEKVLDYGGEDDSCGRSFRGVFCTPRNP